MRKAIRGSLLAMALIVLAAGIMAVGGVAAGTAGATPGSGLSPAIVSRGVASASVHFNTGEVKFQTKAPVAIVNQTIAFAAPSTTGWHAHPGVVLVTVTSGSLTRYDDTCSPTVYPAGSAFLESGDHAGLVRNESLTITASVNVTYLVPEGVQNADLRINKANPGCPQS